MLLHSAIQTIDRVFARAAKTSSGSKRAATPAAFDSWGSGSSPAAVDERPGCAFGLANRRGLDDLVKDFDRLETKVNGLLLGVAATLLVEVLRSWR